MAKLHNGVTRIERFILQASVMDIPFSIFIRLSVVYWPMGLIIIKRPYTHVHGERKEKGANCDFVTG